MGMGGGDWCEEHHPDGDESPLGLCVFPLTVLFYVSPGSGVDGLALRELRDGSRAERSFITNVWPALDASSVCRKRSVASAGWPSMRRAAFARLRSAGDCRSGGYAVCAPRLEEALPRVAFTAGVLARESSAPVNE